ncbi:MAG TPA: hypothetical protein VHJ69_01700 [Gemmatimonadales bacterium]|jgi:hypothetical protein|nr:hypothetical protein [Gemmatimonadales bacterium]
MPNTRRTLPALLVAAALTGCSGKSIYQPEPKPEPSESKKSTAATLGIPPGHLPPAGQCRVWMPGKPPGHQAKARGCANIEAFAPAGSWIVYGPVDSDAGPGKGKGKAKGHDKRLVRVRVVDDRRAGVIVWVRVFDAASGVLVSEERG